MCLEREPICYDREKEINLAGDGMADVCVKKAGETPGHAVEEQQVHNERWAGALRLMGRFIISHYQLIPLDRLGPAGMHQGYVKERGKLREKGS